MDHALVVVLCHGVVAHFKVFSDDRHTAHFQLCTAVLTEHNMQCFWYSNHTLKLWAMFPLNRGCLAVSGTSQMVQFSPVPWFYVRGHPRAHGGCRSGWWAAWNKAGGLHMVCHSFVCLSLQMEIVCSPLLKCVMPSHYVYCVSIEWY